MVYNCNKHICCGLFKFVASLGTQPWRPRKCQGKLGSPDAACPYKTLPCIQGPCCCCWVPPVTSILGSDEAEIRASKGHMCNNIFHYKCYTIMENWTRCKELKSQALLYHVPFMYFTVFWPYTTIWLILWVNHYHLYFKWTFIFDSLYLD